LSAQPFHDDEIETLRRGAMGAGLLVAVSDRSFFDTFKEAGALAKHLVAARGSSQSPLVQRLAEGAGTGFGITSSPDEIESRTVAALEESARILETKASNERDHYRDFVLGIARSVSSAAGGGDEAEAAAIEKIETALGRGR
jgi:hypothetical protein